MSEIYVDPATSQAPVIRVEGVCYQNAGPSDNEPDPSIVIDEELNTCDECTYREASDCKTGDLADVWMTTDDAEQIKGAFTVGSGCYYFDSSVGKSGSYGDGTLYTAEQVQPIESCDECPDCITCGYCCVAMGDYITLSMTFGAADVTQGSSDPGVAEFQAFYNSLVAGGPIVVDVPFISCDGTSVYGDGIDTTITPDYAPGETLVGLHYGTPGYEANAPNSWSIQWTPNGADIGDTPPCCGFTLVADIDLAPGNGIMGLQWNNPDPLHAGDYSSNVPVTVTGVIHTRCCIVTSNDDGTAASCGVAGSCQTACNPVG